MHCTIYPDKQCLYPSKDDKYMLCLSVALFESQNIVYKAAVGQRFGEMVDLKLLIFNVDSMTST